MRYFAALAYNGTHYKGWQRQPNATTVQQVIEEAMTLILRKETKVMGCGRTDTGVHAKYFIIHFDHEGGFPEGFLNRLNKFLPKDIVFYWIKPVAEKAHARFDAYHRSYEYHLDFHKNPFQQDTAFHFPFAGKLDVDQMKAAAKMLLEYKEFAPFCKTKSDAKTMICEMKIAEWEVREAGKKLVFHISANRFLRGMVRLIVGMCLNVGLGRISLDELKTAMESQKPLKRSLSVAAKGLYLTEVRYPFIERE